MPKFLTFLIICTGFIANAQTNSAQANAETSGETIHNDNYNIYKSKPYENEKLAHYIQIPKTWSPKKITSENAELTASPKPIALFGHNSEPGKISTVQILAASLEFEITPLGLIQFYLNKISQANKIYIHSITPIDDYRAKADVSWTLNIDGKEVLLDSEIFLNISKERNRVFIVQALTNEEEKEEWSKKCDYIFRSFSIIN